MYFKLKCGHQGSATFKWNCMSRRAIFLTKLTLKSFWYETVLLKHKFLTGVRREILGAHLGYKCNDYVISCFGFTFTG